jgi:uncharacterized SAM-binding protein YcdF (DUF218 family)
MLAAVAIVVVVLLSGLGLFVWTTVEGIRHPAVDQLPDTADAVMVFAGEADRFDLGWDLVESGVAPVLVLNAVDLPANAVDWCDWEATGFDVVCLIPSNDGTRGEAQAFGELATQRGWTSVVGVTGDYHVQRAKLLLRRCFGGQVVMAQLNWDKVSSEVVRKELLAIGQAVLVERSC